MTRLAPTCLTRPIFVLSQYQIIKFLTPHRTYFDPPPPVYQFFNFCLTPIYFDLPFIRDPRVNQMRRVFVGSRAEYTNYDDPVHGEVKQHEVYFCPFSCSVLMISIIS